MTRTLPSVHFTLVRVWVSLLKNPQIIKNVRITNILTLIKSAESSTSWRKVSLAEKLSVSLDDAMEDSVVIELNNQGKNKQNDGAKF